MEVPFESPLDEERAALRASEKTLQLIIDTIPAMAWAARPDGSAEFFNQHYLDFIGLSAAQAREWGWLRTVHDDDLPGLVATWRDSLASARQGEAEARLCRHDAVYLSMACQRDAVPSGVSR